MAFALALLVAVPGSTPVWTLLAMGGARWAVQTYRPLAERYDAPSP